MPTPAPNNSEIQKPAKVARIANSFMDTRPEGRAGTISPPKIPAGSSTGQENGGTRFTHLIRHAISFVFNNMPASRQPIPPFPDRLCAVIATPSARQALAHLRQALSYTRTVELRLDWLRSDRERSALLAGLRRRRLRGV